ncbi:MAG TPA: phosphotransferase [candidate division Zixibacteria bacterium]|nr:phosphotransferase [candidate division Zixibacteria bacterium]
MIMYEPSLSLLRSVVSSDIRSVTAEPIKRSSTPAATYRVRLDSIGAQVPHSVLIKRIDDDWPDDPLGHEREVRFYQLLLPRLDIAHPHIFYAGIEPDSSHQVVIMEDVGNSHHFPPPDHVWTQSEIEMILHAYARLHEHGQHALPSLEERGWMMDRHENRLYETAEKLPHMVEKLVAQNIWSKMPGFGRLLERTLHDAQMFSSHPVTVLHNDVYPPNCGLPMTNTRDVTLLDWEMVGWGLEELDLGFMFLQPFGSHRVLDRKEANSCYWRERERLGSPGHSSVERQKRQEFADSLWSLWLIPVAYRMAESPYPVGSTPRNYWTSMFKVLGDRLQILSHAV